MNPLLFDCRSLELYVASEIYRPSDPLPWHCMIAYDPNNDIINRRQTHIDPSISKSITSLAMVLSSLSILATSLYSLNRSLRLDFARMTDVGRNTKRKRKETSQQRSIYLVSPVFRFNPHSHPSTQRRGEGSDVQGPYRRDADDLGKCS